MSKTETQSEALLREIFERDLIDNHVYTPPDMAKSNGYYEIDEIQFAWEMALVAWKAAHASYRHSGHSELRRLDAENKALRARLEIDPSHPIDGIAARDETIRQLEAQMRALLGEMDAYALVPKEPSDAMRRAAQKADHDHGPHAEWLEDEWRGFRRVWNAMLAAAKTGDAA